MSAREPERPRPGASKTAWTTYALALEARGRGARAILRQHVDKYIPEDAEAATSTGTFSASPPCRCQNCRTYRAALWLFDEEEGET